MREPAGQQHAQFGPHFIAKLGVALGLGRLPLQRIHLARDFVKNVIDAGEILSGVFEAGFRQPFAGLELGDAGGLFDDGPAIGRLAAQDLPDASLLNDGVGLRPQAGAHEDVLNIAQAAQLAIQQVFALAGAEEAPGDHDLAGLEGPLELAAADLEHDVRSSNAIRCGTSD